VKNFIPILAMVLAAAWSARADAIDISLDSPMLSGTSGDVLQFSGTLTNTTGSVVYLNADSFDSTLPDASTIDDSPFFNNAPLFLGASGTSGDIGLFNIAILGSFAPGTYTGTFTLLGGAGPDSQDILGSADFTVVVNQTTGVPEPATLPLLGAGMSALLAWKRTRRVRPD